jgi:hypothetical protein
MVGILNGRLNTSGSADPQHSLIVYRRVMIAFQIVPEPPVPLIWALIVDRLNDFCNTLIFCPARALLAG